MTTGFGNDVIVYFWYPLSGLERPERGILRVEILLECLVC